MASTLKTDNLSTLSGTGAVNFLQSVDISGNIDFTGNLLQNGQPFVTLPEQSIETMGAMLASDCLLYTSPSPRDLSTSRMPSSA